MDIWIGQKLVPAKQQAINNITLENPIWPITVIDGPWYDSRDEVEKWMVCYQNGAVELWVESELQLRFKEQDKHFKDQLKEPVGWSNLIEGLGRAYG